MADSYFARLRRRAWTMTKADVGLRDRRAAIVKALWVIAALLLMWQFGWNEMAINRVGNLGATLIALVAVLTFVFVWNLCAAAAAIQGEADAKIAELELKIENRAARQEAMNGLWLLRSDGISLRNDPVNTDAVMSSWETRYEKWNVAVLNRAEEIDPNLRQWLERLDRTVERPSNVAIFNTRHEQLVRVTSTMLDRMQRYLERDLVNPSR